MPCQPLRRFRKLSACCPVANIRLRLDPAQSGKKVAKCRLRNSINFSKSYDSVRLFMTASTFHLYKRKGNNRACDNHRGISLLSTAGKALARVLVSPVTAHLERGLLLKCQCGSRKIAALSKWCLLPGSLKKSVWNRTLTCTLPKSI